MLWKHTWEKRRAEWGMGRGGMGGRERGSVGVDEESSETASSSSETEGRESASLATSEAHQLASRSSQRGSRSSVEGRRSAEKRSRRAEKSLSEQPTEQVTERLWQAGVQAAGTTVAAAAFGPMAPVVVEVVATPLQQPRAPAQQDLVLTREGRSASQPAGKVMRPPEPRARPAPPSAAAKTGAVVLAQATPERAHLSCAAKSLGCCVILLRCVCLLLLGGALVYGIVFLSGLVRELMGESVWECLSSKGPLAEKAGPWPRVGLYGVLGAASLLGVMALSGACGAVGLLGERRCCLCCDCVAAVLWALLVLGLLGGTAWGLFFLDGWTGPAEGREEWGQGVGLAMQLRPLADRWEKGRGLLHRCCGALGTHHSYCRPIIPHNIAARLVADTLEKHIRDKLQGDTLEKLIRDKLQGRVPEWLDPEALWARKVCMDLPAILESYASYASGVNKCELAQLLVQMLRERPELLLRKGRCQEQRAPLTSAQLIKAARAELTNGRLSFLLCPDMMRKVVGKVVRGQAKVSGLAEDARHCLQGWADTQTCPGLKARGPEALLLNLVLLLLRTECVVPESCCGEAGCGSVEVVEGWWLGEAEERAGCGAEVLGTLRAGLVAALALLSVAAAALLAEAVSQHCARRRLKPKPPSPQPLNLRSPFST